MPVIVLKRGKNTENPFRRTFFIMDLNWDSEACGILNLKSCLTNKTILSTDSACLHSVTICYYKSQHCHGRARF